MNDQAEIEQLKEQEEVKAAHKQTTGTKEAVPAPVPELRDKLWFGTYIFVLIGLLAFYYLLGSDLISAETRYIPTLRSLVLGAVSIVLAVAIAKSIRVYLINQIENKPARYNTRIIMKLLDKMNAEPERVLFPRSNLR